MKEPAMRFRKSLSHLSATLLAPLCGAFLMWSTAANAGGFPDSDALWLSGAFFETTAAQPTPGSYFTTSDPIHLALVFDYFGDRTCTVNITAKMAGKTVGGQNYKRVITQPTTVGEIADEQAANGFPMTWVTFGLFPAGYYRVKVKVKGVKPCKGVGKADLYLEIY
jgi:hypothetical protein